MSQKLIIESGERGRIMEDHGISGALLLCALELYDAASSVSFYEAAESPQYGIEQADRERAKARLRKAREKAEELDLEYELTGFLLGGV